MTDDQASGARLVPRIGRDRQDAGTFHEPVRVEVAVPEVVERGHVADLAGVDQHFDDLAA
ncbi:hypothetical protein [Frankia nepalensis]|uniref:Uncharacterized protein n=1 Tax=Frankia nepalensis TaxID=1836974 RepID=A0A937UJT5_9ACTN|nr:hypothetical protein [Frankia nepalensis]MBL7496953.1 hypothetical protein [Frankia nepalensis]MBL7626114.1 hypothetical protein [Frankia nepalensis]